jgi:predicted 3-demethylubiquinone-9 3-methyltransferase (glyoxalase superfamily)
MQKITPFLWFDGKAEEAMNFDVFGAWSVVSGPLFVSLDY